jgi:dipeptidyl aminopeptidase/acylaminoacyl peptidase
VSDDNLRVQRWKGSDKLVLESADRGSYDFASRVIMRKELGEWKEDNHDTAIEVFPEIVLEEGMNFPPKILAIDPKSRQKVLLLDLNPQLRQLALANVEEITWRARDGHEVKGGLFYPIDYVPGVRYPLVIQTHGWWGPKRFRLDGPWSADYAAQVFAGKGIMVLQAEEERQDDLAAVAKYTDTPVELRRAVSVYEAAIDQLNQKGLIDQNRVGIVGFSRTCAYVKFALTHSEYHFAAAVVMDGMDSGYFQYTAFGGQTARESEMLNGGVPYGTGLQAWIDRSPIFSVERVNSPLLILAPNPMSLIGEWEWFTALSRLSKPVELLTMEDGLHELEKPRERKSAEEHTADWLTFWLKGEEEADPDKTEQYERWRRLRRSPQ